MRHILFVAGFLLCSCAVRAEANDPVSELRAVCPEIGEETLPHSADERVVLEGIARSVYARRYELGSECLLHAKLWVQATEFRTPTPQAFEFSAFVLTRTIHDARLCHPAWPGDLDIAALVTRSLLQGDRYFLNLRDSNNRQHLASALRASLEDQRVFAHRPASCPGGAAAGAAEETHIAGVRALVNAVIQSLPEERSVGLATSWAAIPDIEAEIGMELERSESFPGPDIERHWLVRSGGRVWRVPLVEGEARYRRTRVSVYVTPASQIGIIDTWAWAVDRGNGQRISTSLDPNSWRYVGAFDRVTERSSGGAVASSTWEFIPAQTQPECIPASGQDAPTFRAAAHKAQCDGIERFSAEYLYSAALSEVFGDWQRRSAGSRYRFDIEAPPAGLRATGSAEFLVFAHRDVALPSHVAPPTLAIKAVDAEVESADESAPRFAARGVGEYWAIDVRLRRIVAFSNLDDGRYQRRRIVNAWQTVRARWAPEIELRLVDLDLENAADLNFHVR